MNIKRWSISNVLILKKSKFKGFCIPIKSNLKIPELLKEIYKLDKNLEKASHPTMYAWKTANSENDLIEIKNNKGKKNELNLKNRILINRLSNLNQGFHDNHESGSGLRLMGLLDRLHLINILVVVTRWYGGTPLGPARFKCISDVGMESLENGGYLKIKANNKNWIDCSKIE